MTTPPHAHTPKVALLYSGGSDSTLAAIRLLEQHEHLTLLTMSHRGHVGAELIDEQMIRLGRYLGDPGRLDHAHLPVDALFRFLSYERYMSHLWRYGTFMLSVCGLCKLAIHWRALLYCRDHGVDRIADGAVKSMSAYPAQNERVMLGPMRELYQEHGIRYENPVFEEDLEVPRALYELRYHPRVDIKGTTADLQASCTMQRLHAFFLRCHPGFEEDPRFWQRLEALYAEKIALVREMTREHIARGDASRLARLLEEAS
jgi:hypothetical protein